ncbi:hypothetical protein CA13_10320 [Planctomycetes bacterium CA13]|uniref:Uncharacterized protein n=2 Tax=Novipirellula herctigrandis TaxID=2527986 RepID=A0A5C5YX50_9BACT|nr:hypothetical protein CA13_10320 [Planctomycetes bacterium CA13]
MLLTAGISIAFFVARGIEHLRFPADAHYYKLECPSGVHAFGMLIAAIYGLCVTMVVLAIRARDFWLSPGKTLALLFTTMCVLNWSLEFIASAVTYVRMQTDLAPGVVDRRGYILGIWYGNFAVDVGYVACLPVLLWVICKTKNQPFCFRLTWVGFLFFALLIIGQVHLGFRTYVGSALNFWYFEAAIGIPICLLIAAIARSVTRRDAMDWWTIMTAVPVISVWFVAISLKLLA